MLHRLQWFIVECWERDWDAGRRRNISEDKKSWSAFKISGKLLRWMLVFLFSAFPFHFNHRPTAVSFFTYPVLSVFLLFDTFFPNFFTFPLIEAAVFPYFLSIAVAFLLSVHNFNFGTHSSENFSR